MARARRICAHPQCTEPVYSARCTTHEREFQQQREKQRGTAAQRGYGHDHRKLTEAALKNATRCSECGQRFTSSNPATGGHVIARRRGGSSADGIVAQCARCNYGWRRTGL